MKLTFAKKKDCAALLAQLGEESLRAAVGQGDTKFSRVSWCQNRILTLESLGENLLVRVAAALPICHALVVERLMQEAAMRESGYYQFSTRGMDEFILAQIMLYTAPNHPELIQELDGMYAKLDEALGMS